MDPTAKLDGEHKPNLSELNMAIPNADSSLFFVSTITGPIQLAMALVASRPFVKCLLVTQSGHRLFRAKEYLSIGREGETYT